MTDKEINRATINAFLARCINRGAAEALDHAAQHEARQQEAR